VSLFEVVLIVSASDLVVFLSKKLDLVFAAPELLKAGLERGTVGVKFLSSFYNRTAIG